MTKFEQAYAKFLENTNVARKDFIARLVAELGMTEAGASTYHSNCKKKFKESGEQAAAPVQIAVEKKVVEVAAETAAPVAKRVLTKRFEGIDDGDYSCVPLFLRKQYGAA